MHGEADVHEAAKLYLEALVQHNGGVKAVDFHRDDFLAAKPEPIDEHYILDTGVVLIEHNSMMGYWLVFKSAEDTVQDEAYFFAIQRDRYSVIEAIRVLADEIPPANDD